MSERNPEVSEDVARRRQDASAQLALAVRRARLTLLWERLWPGLAGVATVIGLFLALSWLGLWLWLPPLGRAIALGLFAVLLLAALIPLVRLRVPTEAESLRRLDRASGLRHRPATAISDVMATPQTDAGSSALWRAHVERSLAAARALRAGPARPRLALRDPVALRALVLILAVATFFAAGGERLSRITAAFDWQGVVLPANFRVDAWVNPPPYTGKPPQILPGLQAGESFRTADAVSTPAGSTLVVRATGKVDLAVEATGGLVKAAAETAGRVPTGSEEYRFTIKESGALTLRGAGSQDVTWRFTAIPDKPPTIALAKEAERTLRGSLKLTYKVEDDYGVTGAKATFARKAQPEDADEVRPLFKAPDFDLSLPQLRTRSGTGVTLKDLSKHPWAGSEVAMTLTARDQGGNEARSKTVTLRLPERLFRKPLARALIEQRRILALDGNARPRVLAALDALTIAPERFTPDAGTYLGLTSIAWMLTRARSDDQLRDVVARLWQMAVDIEDGNLSDAERALRQAQDALRQALERNAPDDEIKKLTDQLRAALDKFMQQLAEQMRRNPQQLARPLDPNTRVLRPQDLQNMIDRLENLARSGAKDAARQLLDQLQSMLENLQTAQPGMQQPGDNDMMQSLNELGDMIRKQQQLRDRTFREGQDQRRRQGQNGRRSMEQLRQDQQALRDRLSKLMEQLRQRGQMPGQGQQKGQQGQQGQTGQLGEAGKAMGDAQGQLGEGDADNAVDSQGRALEALRKGAQGLAQAMQQQMGRGPGPGQPGQGPPSRAQQDTDPLGRPLRGRDFSNDTTVKVPGQIDAQRARQILEELRRRYGESFRPQLELDYIERLLKDF